MSNPSEQPAVVQCSMGNVALTFPNTAGTDSNGDLTTDGGWDWPKQQKYKNTKDGDHQEKQVPMDLQTEIYICRTPTGIAPGCDVAKIYEKVVQPFQCLFLLITYSKVPNINFRLTVLPPSDNIWNVHEKQSTK